MTKIHTPSFFTGDQLQYWMLTHLNYQHPIGEFFVLYPVLLVTFGYITAVWEISFIFCSWKSSWRSIVLPIGILFHFMTTLTLGLLMFPMVCYCTYLSFVDEDDIAQISAWIRQTVERFHWLKPIQTKLLVCRDWFAGLPRSLPLSRLGFAVAVPLAALFGIAIEYQRDVYGERRPEGRYTLVAIEPSRVQQMLAPVTPQRDIDKFFAIDIGSIMIGDILADRRTSFRQGERMITQCNLLPPHEDMVVECKIRDEDNRVVDRQFTIATREMFRVNLTFQFLDAMIPGQYVMTIETAGRHVMKKKFSILPKFGTVASRG